jgi:hypothetical protein
MKRFNGSLNGVKVRSRSGYCANDELAMTNSRTFCMRTESGFLRVKMNDGMLIGNAEGRMKTRHQ